MVLEGMPKPGVRSILETGGQPRQEPIEGTQTETVETKVWGGETPGVSVVHTITSNNMTREEMAAISRRFVVEHYRLTYALFLEGAK